MAIFRSHEVAPGWCELEHFEVVDLALGQAVQHRRVTPRERVIGCFGAVQLIYPGGSVLLREGQFFDIDLLDGLEYSLKGCTPKAQAVRLSGHWGADISGCGIFRVENQANPSDSGDPVPYTKRTRIDSHYHDCDEYWIVLEGRATVVVGGTHMAMGPGDCVTIGMGHHHDMPEAPEPVKAVYFETTLERQKRVGHLWNHTHGIAVPHPERI